MGCTIEAIFTRMARAKFAPTDRDRRVVEQMVRCGIAQSDIARAIGVSLPTLHKYFRDDLDNGMAHANAKVANALFATACGKGRGAVVAQIFWLKARAGWKEKQLLEHANTEGQPFQLIFSNADSKL